MKKTFALALALMSLSSFAGNVDLQCLGGSLQITNGDVSASEIFLNETVTVGEEKSVLILVEKDNMRVVTETGLDATDDGKTLLVLSQNIDPEGTDPVGLNVTRAKLDLATDDGLVLQTMDQQGDIASVNFTKIDFAEKFFLKCVSVK